MDTDDICFPCQQNPPRHSCETHGPIPNNNLSGRNERHHFCAKAHKTIVCLLSTMLRPLTASKYAKKTKKKQMSFPIPVSDNI